jgi:SAM-dependent methyltransferase
LADLITMIEDLAPGLTRGADGIWRSGVSRSISYPAEGNRKFAAVEENSFWFNHRSACVCMLLSRFRPGGVILDVGGGNGYMALGMTRAGFDVVVVEPGPDGCRLAHDRGLEVIGSTLADVGFKTGSVAAIGMFDVLEHIEDEAGALGQVKNLLASGGRFFVTVPAFAFLWADEDVQAGHYRRYRTGQLAAALRRAGLEVEYISYMFMLLPLPILLMRTLPSLLGGRADRSPQQISADHTARGGVSGQILAHVLAFERRRIAAGGRFPFGSSCVAVARKP